MATGTELLIYELALSLMLGALLLAKTFRLLLNSFTKKAELTNARINCGVNLATFLRFLQKSRQVCGVRFNALVRVKHAS